MLSYLEDQLIDKFVFLSFVRFTLRKKRAISEKACVPKCVMQKQGAFKQMHPSCGKLRPSCECNSVRLTFPARNSATKEKPPEQTINARFLKSLGATNFCPNWSSRYNHSLASRTSKPLTLNPKPRKRPPPLCLEIPTLPLYCRQGLQVWLPDRS